MKTEIDIFRDKIWVKNVSNKILNKKKVHFLLKECFLKTNTIANIIFLNISCIDSKTMAKYNEKYRGKPYATNVLSFELNDCDNKIVKYGKKYDFLVLGDMVLCYEKIKEEAEKYNKTFEERLYHLIVHSILHLLGYDHINDNEREIMEKLEEKILNKFGINDIYTY